MNLNKVFILGNLTRDPELRTTPSGQSVVNFSIATNRVWNDSAGQKQQKAEFHNIVAWGKLAEICSQYLTKGKLVLIEGRLETRTWQGQDGIKHYKTEIIAENMQMGPKLQKSDIAPSNLDTNTNPPQENAPEEPKEDVNLKDIPF